MNNVIPESVILSTINTLMKYLRLNFAASVTEQDSYLYKLWGASNLGRYDFFEQSKELFINPGNHKEPKFVNVSMGFDPQKVSDPHIHIMSQNSNPDGKDGLGFDEGYNQVISGVDDTLYENYYNRNYKHTYNLLITGANENEVIVILYTLWALLISGKDELTSRGFNNISLSSGGVKLERQIVDRLYMRSLFLAFDSDVIIPPFAISDLIKAVDLNLSVEND